MSSRLSVPYPPPLAFALGLFPGLALHRGWPLTLGLAERTELRDLLSSIVFGLGVGSILWAFWTFSAAGTSLHAERSEARLLTRGPYRISRNPIYVGFTLVYIAFSIYRDNAWLLLLLPSVLWLLQISVIRHEERQLEEVFGEEYRMYCQKVRRWL